MLLARLSRDVRKNAERIGVLLHLRGVGCSFCSASVPARGWQRSMAIVREVMSQATSRAELRPKTRAAKII